MKFTLNQIIYAATGTNTLITTDQESSIIQHLIGRGFYNHEWGGTLPVQQRAKHILLAANPQLKEPLRVIVELIEQHPKPTNEIYTAYLNAIRVAFRLDEDIEVKNINDLCHLALTNLKVNKARLSPEICRTTKQLLTTCKTVNRQNQDSRNFGKTKLYRQILQHFDAVHNAPKPTAFKKTVWDHAVDLASNAEQTAQHEKLNPEPNLQKVEAIRRVDHDLNRLAIIFATHQDTPFASGGYDWEINHFLKQQNPPTK